jgi:hypothetical protein
MTIFALQATAGGRAVRAGRCLLIAAVCALSVPALAVERLLVVGEARSLDDQELRYREYHHCSMDGRLCSVLYKDGDGQVFARKQVDYSESLRSPSLLIEDLREGSTLRIDGDFDSDLVVDAGFDNYVRQRWAELAEGETVRFPFLVVGRDSPIKMKASRTERVACNDGALCLTVTLDAWLLSMLVSPIELVYDNEKRLTQYRGISNIRDAQGRSQNVRIEYRYPEDGEGSTS